MANPPQPERLATAHDRVHLEDNASSTLGDALVTALDDYRAHTLGHNICVLEVLVRRAMTTAGWYRDEGVWTGEEITERHMGTFSYLLRPQLDTNLGFSFDDGFKEPMDVLQYASRLVRPCDLDGVRIRADITPEQRTKERTAFLHGLRAELLRQAKLEAAGSIELPRDFCLLLEHVDGVLAQDLPYWGNSCLMFVEGVVPLSRIPEIVITPAELPLNGPNDVGDNEWEFGVGWKCGTVGDMDDGCCAAYCRRKDQSWRWRYYVYGRDWTTEEDWRDGCDDMVGLLGRCARKWDTPLDEEDLWQQWDNIATPR